jgi:hypothetical protein
VKGSPAHDETPEVEKPLTPDAAKAAPKDSKPMSPSGTQSSPGTAMTLNPSATQKTPSAKMSPSPSVGDAPQSLRLAESPKMTPPSPQSHGLDSIGEVPSSSNIAQPPPKDSSQHIPCVVDTLTKDPNFIKARFHIGRFIIAAVNTEGERIVTESLRSIMDSTSQQINVSFFLSAFTLRHFPILTSLLIQKIIEHSQSKNKYIRVAPKRLTET